MAGDSALVTYPAFVSCEGPGFAPLWHHFRLLREDALRVGLSQDGLIELQATATYIIDQWGEQSVEFVTGWHKEFFELRDSNQVVQEPSCWRDGLCQLPLHTPWLLPLADPTVHGGFCLHGYVAALSCLLHHLHGRIGGENEKALTARMQNALGPERSLELLLESSPWNLSSRQLGLAAEPPVPAIDFTPWAWRPLPMKDSSGADQAPFRTASLAIVGHHAGMSLEPAMAMAAILAELAEEERLSVSFFGQYYACEILQRCDQDSLQDVFRRWMFDQPLREALGRTPVAVWPELREAAQREPQLMKANVWICTGIWPLCWMLQKISQQPVLHYMVNWLVGEHTPQEWHVSLMAEAARIGAESFNGGAHHFCTTAWARLSIDISYLIGLKVPNVSAIAWHTALHAGPSLRWRRKASKASKAFVPRNVLMRRVQGQVFASMLGHFNALPWVQPVEVEVWQGGFDSINRDAGDPWRGEVQGKIWWSNAVEYMAAVYLAGDITLLTFNELYALRVPTLVPDVAWQARIMADMCQTGIGWFFPHSPLYHLAEGEETFAFSPWGCDSLDRLRYWLQTADAWRFPHVSHVTSFVHLYQTLQSWLDSDEPQRLSDAMAKYHLEISTRSLSYFRSLLAAKLPQLPLPEAPSSPGVLAALQISAVHTLRRSLKLKFGRKSPFAVESCPLPRIVSVSPRFGGDLGWDGGDYDINLTFDQPVRFPNNADPVQGEMVIGCKLQEGQFLPLEAPANRRVNFVIQVPINKRVMLSDRVVQIPLGTEQFWARYECRLNVTRGAVIGLDESVPNLETRNHVVFISDNVPPMGLQFSPRLADANVDLGTTVATVTMSEPWYLMIQQAELWRLKTNAGPDAYEKVSTLLMEATETGEDVEQLRIPLGPLAPDTLFSIVIPAGAMVDRSNNNFTGLEVGEWAFRTDVATELVEALDEGLSPGAITGIVLGSLALVGTVLLCIAIQRYKLVKKFENREVKPMEGGTPKASQVAALHNDSELLPSNEKFWEKALIRSKEDLATDTLEDLPLELPGALPGASNRRPSVGSQSLTNQRRPSGTASNQLSNQLSNQRHGSKHSAGSSTNMPSNQRRPSRVSNDDRGVGSRRPSNPSNMPSNQRIHSKQSADSRSRRLSGDASASLGLPNGVQFLQVGNRSTSKDGSRSEGIQRDGRTREESESLAASRRAMLGAGPATLSKPTTPCRAPAPRQIAT